MKVSKMTLCHCTETVQSGTVLWKEMEKRLHLKCDCKTHLVGEEVMQFGKLFYI